MRSVMISIRPKWVEKIANGEKTIEVRKTKPNLETPFKCYIYCTKGRETLLTGNKTAVIGDYRNAFTCNADGKTDWNIGNGKVIGEFTCDKIEMFMPTIVYDSYEYKDDYHFEYYFSNKCEEKSCLSNIELYNYGKGKTLYFLHIFDLKIYDKPKELNEFYKPCIDKYGYCQGCKHGLISIPPDEEEYAYYHGGTYERFNTTCLNVLKRPPQSWCYVEVDLE